MRYFLVAITIIYLLVVFVLIIVKCISRLQKKSEEETPILPLIKTEDDKEIPMKAKTKYSKKAEKTIKKVVKKFDKGELHSGSKKGPVVTSPKQMIAIGISEAKKKGERVPPKKK